MEATFRKAGITVSATKYYYVFMKLLHKARMSVRDIVRAAAGLSDLYKRVKAKLTTAVPNPASSWFSSSSTTQTCTVGRSRPQLSFGSRGQNEAQLSQICFIWGTFKLEKARKQKSTKCASCGANLTQLSCILPSGAKWELCPP